MEKNCYIYLRVSTDEQANEGFSLDNQKRSCLDYAQMHGYHVKRIFEDGGKSGRSTDRPAFQELLSLMKESPVDAVIIYKIDRFARNVGDFSNIRKEFKSLGIKLMSVSENGDVTEGLIGNIFASVAEWESEVNGQRTKDALMQKYREGWQPTPPPMGYLTVGGDRERKTCEPDPYLAPIIKELFELYATGNYSLIEITDWLVERNVVSKTGTPLGHSVVCNILRNSFYYGLIRWKGESKIGKHIPIISINLFETCQYVLAKHRNFLIRRRQHNYLLRGFIYCAECGQRYTAEPHPNHNKHNPGIIHYYHCQKKLVACPAPYVEMSKLEDQVVDQFKNVQFSQEFIEAVTRKAREKLDNSRKNADSLKQGVLNQKSAFEMKRNKLEDALIDGTIDRDTYKRKHGEIQNQINLLESQILNMESDSQIDIELIDEVLAFTRNIHQAYQDAPDFLKRYYLRFFYERIVIKKKEIVDSVATPIFASLLANHQVIITNLSSPV